MLEQLSRLSDGDYGQSAMVQLFLDCVDRATEPSTAFVSFRERHMHFDDNEALSLRVLDPIADDGVSAIIDDGCNGCYDGEVWRQNAEAKMKVLGLHPAQEGNYFQWRWNEQDEGKVENAHGHTIARI